MPPLSACSRIPLASAGPAAGLDYFGKMDVKDKTFDDAFVFIDRAQKPRPNAADVMRHTLTGQIAEGRTDAAGHLTHTVDGVPENITLELKRAERP